MLHGMPVPVPCEFSIKTFQYIFFVNTTLLKVEGALFISIVMQQQEATLMNPDKNRELNEGNLL